MSRFIGSHLVDLLLKKDFRLVIDNLSGGRLENIKHHKKIKFNFKKLDINKISNNEKIFKNVNYVFHLAGKGDIVPSIENPASYMLNKCTGTTNVLENCRNKKIKKKNFCMQRLLVMELQKYQLMNIIKYLISIHMH